VKKETINQNELKQICFFSSRPTSLSILGGGSVYSFQRISAYQETAQLIGFSSDKGKGDGEEEYGLADVRSKPLKPISLSETCWPVVADFIEQILC
jgi:hypothetical protein